MQVLDANQDLGLLLSSIAMPKTKFFNFDILDEASAPARVKLLMPPGFREEEMYTFALILKVNWKFFSFFGKINLYLF